MSDLFPGFRKCNGANNISRVSRRLSDPRALSKIDSTLFHRRLFSGLRKTIFRAKIGAKNRLRRFDEKDLERRKGQNSNESEKEGKRVIRERDINFQERCKCIYTAILKKGGII